MKSDAVTKEAKKEVDKLLGPDQDYSNASRRLDRPWERSKKHRLKLSGLGTVI